MKFQMTNPNYQNTTRELQLELCAPLVRCYLLFQLSFFAFQFNAKRHVNPTSCNYVWDLVLIIGYFFWIAMSADETFATNARIPDTIGQPAAKNLVMRLRCFGRACSTGNEFVHRWACRLCWERNRVCRAETCETLRYHFRGGSQCVLNSECHG